MISRIYLLFFLPGHGRHAFLIACSMIKYLTLSRRKILRDYKPILFPSEGVAQRGHSVHLVCMVVAELAGAGFSGGCLE